MCGPLEMGAIARTFLPMIGSAVGRSAGRKLGKLTGIHEQEGGMIGRRIGTKVANLLPFKKGGRVKKTGKILIHKGEFLLPKNVKPTKKQVAAVRKRRAHK